MSERDIFTAARAMTEPVVRSAYLDGACAGDRALRDRVETLLRAHDQPDSLLDVPLAAPPDPNHAATRAFAPDLDHAATRTAGGTPGSAEDDEALSFLTPSTRPDSLGRIGHYEVLQVLGKGGFGIVFRAFDDTLQRVVAVKVMAPQLAATSPARKRFLREARTSAQVRHENVVQVYEVAEQPLPYLAMEFIPGETLQQMLDRNGPLDVTEVLRIGRQVAEGLAAAHATDLIHRDIKPSNVMIEGGPRHQVKITDFGLARAADDASISQSGIIAGTPMYMAPEQALGHKLDQRADLFSLGSVLYQMAAGRAPFRANSTVAVLKRVAEDTPRDIREIIPETPPWLCDIIAKLHAKEPDDRYQSARDVADVLADCEAQLKTNCKLKDFSRIPRSKARPSGRRKWVAAAAVLLLPMIALAVTEFAGVTHLFRGQPATHDPIQPGNEPTLAGNEPTLAGNERTPATLPEVPNTAADVPPYLVGNWKLEKQDRDPNSPPNTDPFVGAIAYGYVAGDKFLRGRISVVSRNDGGTKETLDLWSLDPGKKSMRRWLIDSTGVIHDNISGDKFNPTTRTLTTSLKFGANRFDHLYEITDSSTFYHQVTTKNASGTTIDEVRNKWTRVAGPVTFPSSPSDPNRPAETKVLDRLVGEWLNNKTITTLHLSAKPPLDHSVSVVGPDTTIGHRVRVKAQPILGGRFIEKFETIEGTSKNSDYTLSWFDTDVKKYRTWFFNHAGSVSEFIGSWKEAEKILVWKSLDGGFEGAWKFMSDDLRHYAHAVTAKDGTVINLATGASRRIASNTLPPTFKNSIGMEFVKVPKGQSWLGGGKDKLGDEELEMPADFYLGKYEVTQEEWEKVMGENPSHFSRTGEGKDAVKDIPDADLKRFAVENVSWDQCQLFVAKLNQREKETGWVYRLPMEEEWEYACRGGPMADKRDSAFDFYFAKPTNTLLPEQANFKDSGPNRTCKVGIYKPNKLGLDDMHGNVREWCVDEVPADSKEPEGAARRVARGGGWHHDSGYCGAASRIVITPATRYLNLGLRLARVPAGAPSPEAKTVARADAVSFDRLTFQQIKGLMPRKRAASIDAGPGPTNNAPAGTVLVYRTNEGRYGKCTVVKNDGNLEMKWLTYDGTGAVFSQGEQLVVRPTWYCDLDAGKECVRESDSAADFFLNAHTAQKRTIDRMNGAVLQVVSDGGVIQPKSPPPTYKNSLGMEFVIVPKGKSWLGGGKDKPGDKEVEMPADFYLGKYEVTQGDWEKVMGENPSHFSRTGGGKDAVKDITDADLKRFPVEHVSWDQCQLFVAKLNLLEKETGWVYRLPTEVEWEYACRGGTMSDKADSAFDFYLTKASRPSPS